MRRDWLAGGLTLLMGASAAPPSPALIETLYGPIPINRSEPGELARGVDWRTGAGGLEWTELLMHGRGEARRTLIVAARVDPRSVRLRLENGMAPGGLPVWTLEDAPADALLAVNAGMFESEGVWGWVVHGGVEYRPPRRGPLAAAVLVDSAGQVRLVDDAAVDSLRHREALGGVLEAFQSYPVLVRDGTLPALLRESGPDIDLTHRDARLALGFDEQGRLLVALTRFDALGPALGSVPFGLTLPEIAEVMRGLGAMSAVSLDGGISAQLLVRDGAGTAHRWAGLRSVPLGLSVVSR